MKVLQNGFYFHSCSDLLAVHGRPEVEIKPAKLCQDLPGSCRSSRILPLALLSPSKRKGSEQEQVNGCHDTHWLESSKGLKFEPLKSLTTKNRPGGWNLTPLEVFDCIWSSCQYLWIHCDHCCPAPKVLCRLSSLSSCLTYILSSTELRSINTKHMLSNDDDASISILQHLRWCQHQQKASMFMIVLS